jgi:hypothetical protein
MIKFELINLRDDYSKIEPYYKMYNYLPEYLKEVLIINNQFKIWYKTQSPKYHLILNQIHNIVDIYYNYEQKLLNLDDIYDIFNKINSDDKLNFLKINEQNFKYMLNEDLIKKKQKSVYDIFFQIRLLNIKILDIQLVHSDIISKINLYSKEQSAHSLILKYIYSSNKWYFKNYIHHLRNIYLGIRFYLQKDYMLNRFDKNGINNCDKYYCCVKDLDSNILMGMIVNRYKDPESNEYLQEHIFISNNIKMEIMEEKTKISNLSLKLHSYGSNIEPISKVIYSNPLPSMLKILRESNDIKLNMLSKEEREYIEFKKIVCFRFVPTISIEITEKLKKLYRV